MDRLALGPHRSVCEWKGDASYYRYTRGDRTIENIAWFYPDPKPGFEGIRDHLAFYGGRVDEAWVGDERATPQPGSRANLGGEHFAYHRKYGNRDEKGTRIDISRQR
jgi:hypothetical protein